MHVKTSSSLHVKLYTRVHGSPMRPRLGFLLLVAVLAVAAAGCGADEPTTGPDAVDTSTQTDAAADTGAVADSAATDAGASDGGASDGGASDGGASDGGVADAAIADSGAAVDTGAATDAGNTKDGSTQDSAGANADVALDAGGIKDECNGIDDDKDGLTDEDACDDGDLCTEDKCAPANKQCSWKKIGEGEACDDGDACTQKEKCLGNKCISTEATKCDDGDPCTGDVCSKAIGICEHPAKADGGACDDGDPCTENAACKGGKCGGQPKVCDDGDVCTKDACTPGKGCTTTPADGAACDDGQLCTKNDACAGGKCVGELPKDCAGAGPCQEASCDPKTGACVKTTKKDGAGCDDGDACSSGEVCKAGQCGGGTGTSCSGGTVCEPNVCDKTTGKCAATKLKDGDKCDDGNACTTKETCQAGSCIDIGKVCNDDNVCTTDSCDKATGCKHAAVAGPCEDGDLCTEGEACAGGKCAGAKPKSCDDGAGCSVDTCNKADGTCSHDTKAQEGKPCNDDGSVCTANETCKAGKCQGGSAKVCSDGKPCTADECDPKTGACVFPPAKVGASCDDGSYCTFSDGCDATGKCTGKTFPCDDKNPCTTDACVAASGKCTFTPKKSGDPCDDGDLCTKGDKCSAAGTCTAGSSASCEDGNACTTDSCTPATGKCLNAPNNNACNDGSICTTGDACIGGKCQSGADGSVSVYAGSGSSGVTNGNWNSASFGEPRGITPDGNGGFYVADRSYHRIRHINASRQVTTVAGSGSYGYVNSTALASAFRYPSDVAYDSATATLYISDSSSSCIRKLAGGAVSLVVGNCGTSSSYYGYTEGSGSTARFRYPEALAVAGDGTVVVADRGNHVIRRISGSTTTLVAGGPYSAGYVDGKSSSARFNSPYGLDVNAAGVIFVADSGNARIRAIMPDGTVTTIAGGSAGFGDGYKTAAQFNYPYALTWVKGGYLLVADSNNHRIRKVTLSGVVSTFSGSGTASFLDGNATTARFYYPRGITSDAVGNAYVSDSSNRRIRKVLSGVLTCADNSPCTLDKCDATKGCTFTQIAAGSPCDDDGTCQVGGKCDAKGLCSGTKPKCSDGGPCVTTTCDELSGDCAFKPEGSKCDDGDLCTDGEGCALGKCDASVWKVSTFSGSGTAAVKDGIGAAANHYYPRGMGRDTYGNVYVADYSGHVIRRISPSQSVTTAAGSGNAGFQDGAAAQARFYYPCDVAAHTDGTLYVADRQNHRIRQVDASGNVTTLAGDGNAGFVDGAGNTARFYYPEALDVDAAGTVYVADSYNNRIRKIAANGNVTTFIGNGSTSYQEGTGAGAYVYRPTGVAVAPNGTVFFASYYHHMVRKATPGGVTSLVAGSTSAGFADGTGSSARFYYPSDIAIDSLGRVLVADRQNNRIRRIDANNKVTTLAGTGSAGFTDGTAQVARLYYPYGVTAVGETVYVGDSNNYRVRVIKPPIKDCDDFNPCSTDSCSAKTGQCLHQEIANCCKPQAYSEPFSKTGVAAKMTFYSCTPDKFNIELATCKVESDGVGPKKGWQVHTDAFESHSAPGALYYGNGLAGNYNWGASAGKVITAEMVVPKDSKTTLSFWVYFDTEAPQAFDKFYVWLWVDGKRVVLGDAKAPNQGSLWYKGKPGYTAVKTWSKVELDVSKYSASKLRLEVSFNTGDGLKNFGVGAFIDDIALFTQCGK